MSPEFSRPLRVDSLGTAPRIVAIGANEAERAAIATRFDLMAVDRLEAEAALTRHGDEVRAKGSVSAAVTQTCVATGGPVPATIHEPFEIIFRTHPETSGSEEEIELSGGELDVVFYEGSSVDLGEAVAETLSLAMDPYPRCAEAEAALREAGVKTEEEAAPAGPLAGLKDLLAGKK
jgi:uncharacterized metal-binding protein YceD (DUF177 family)